MWSSGTLRERGLGGFVHDHPWLFALVVGLVGATLAFSNGVDPLPAFANMFLVGAILGLAYSYAMDFVTERKRRTTRRDPVVPSDVDSDPERALQRLRERYADGELTDDEFETRLERLLETETVDSAREYTSRRDTDLEREEA